jgi:hypothetical protein
MSSPPVLPTWRQRESTTSNTDAHHVHLEIHARRDAYGDDNEEFALALVASLSSPRSFPSPTSCSSVERKQACTPTVSRFPAPALSSTNPSLRRFADILFVIGLLHTELRTQTPDSLCTQTPDSLRTQTPDSLCTQTPDSLRTQTPDSLRTQTPDSLCKGHNMYISCMFPRAFVTAHFTDCVLHDECQATSSTHPTSPYSMCAHIANTTIMARAAAPFPFQPLSNTLVHPRCSRSRTGDAQPNTPSRARVHRHSPISVHTPVHPRCSRSRTGDAQPNTLSRARVHRHSPISVHTLVHTRFLRVHARKAGHGRRRKKRRHSGTEKHNRRGAPTASARVAERTSWGEPPQRLVPEETLRLGGKCRRGCCCSNCGVTRRAHCRAVEVSWSGTSSDSDHGRARWD